MAKKVKFPLDMGNEVYVRTLEELKENYNSEKVTEYFLDGRLLTWLNDRYFDDEAEQVQELMEQEDKNNLAAKLGKVFGVEIESEEVDIEALEIRREKLDKLRRITSDDNILENVDSVAFSQEELGDLLDEEKDVIYLCGDKFRIPLSVENMMYIGVNNPVISIGGKGEIDLEESEIIIVECDFSEDTKARLKVNKAADKIQSINMEDFATEKIDGLLCLTEYKGNDKYVEIPDGIEVISEAFYENTDVEVVIIPNSVVTIEDYAFQDCENLKKAEISNSVVTIGDSAFSGCKNLEKVNIPAGVETIGSSAFANCTSLTEINVDPNNTKYNSLNGVLFNHDLSVLIQCPCGISGNYIIPNSVEKIDDSAFSECSKLKSIEIPDSVESIGKSAFIECANLKNIEISYGVTEIGEYAFCSSGLKSIELPDSVETIGEGAFQECSNLTKVTLSESITEISENLFWQCSKLESIEIPYGVKEIKEGAFSECTALEEVVLPKTLKEISCEIIIGAFSGCTSLKEIKLPESLQAIGNHTFENCENLRSINIPSKVTAIEDYTFSGCTNLESVSLPPQINEIGMGAFENCKSLRNITIPTNIDIIPEFVFNNCINITVKHNGKSYKYDKLDKLHEVLLSRKTGLYF